MYHSQLFTAFLKNYRLWKKIPEHRCEPRLECRGNEKNSTVIKLEFFVGYAEFHRSFRIDRAAVFSEISDASEKIDRCLNHGTREPQKTAWNMCGVILTGTAPMLPLATCWFRSASVKSTEMCAYNHLLWNTLQGFVCLLMILENLHEGTVVAEKLVGLLSAFLDCGWWWWNAFWGIRNLTVLKSRSSIPKRWPYSVKSQEVLTSVMAWTRIITSDEAHTSGLPAEHSRTLSTIS